MPHVPVVCCAQALCEALEETNYTLQRELDERDRRVRLLEEELQLQSRQIDNLKRVISRCVRARACVTTATRRNVSRDFSVNIF